ncbi:MAG TPA: hypothetical protein VL403_11125 [Candidatus Kryptonia bacterium]|nr:hypothetical protein [Candidatus Kryptonia bacterium]
MIATLFALTALTAVAVLGWRRARAWREQATRPGRSERTAISITDYGEIDAVVLGERCRCGGRFAIRGEGSRGQLRVVRLECHSCARERVVYFDVREVRH